MMRQTRLAAFAFVTGLALAGAASAQTQGATSPAPTPPATAPADPSALPSATPLAPAPLVKPSDPNADQPVYSVNPPPDSSPGLYLPAVVGGYAKSAAGCVVAGCDDGPDPSGSAAPSTSGKDETPPPLPPANPGASTPR
jgi:hypothetical protein